MFRNVLWNFMGASLSAVRPSGFNDLASAGAQYAAKRGPEARTAILVRSEAEVLLIRAYIGLTIQSHPRIIDVGSRRQEMLDWLGV